MNLNVKLFADGADKKGILEMNEKSNISGFTTNPTLMKVAGVKDYKAFALDILSEIKNKSISFEVFSDDFNEMERQALDIASWGDNIYVKIPITNTKGESTVQLIKKLSDLKVVCNITAIFTLDQLNKVINVLNSSTPAILSVFAGRIADSGINPFDIMKDSVRLAKKKPKSSILWASTREILNIFQADEAGCQIITVSHEILKKFSGIGKDLNKSSLETVSMFYRDAKSAGYVIKKKK